MCPSVQKKKRTRTKRGKNDPSDIERWIAETTAIKPGSNPSWSSRWGGEKEDTGPTPDRPELSLLLFEHKLRGLLNKLNSQNSDSISNQIVHLATHPAGAESDPSWLKALSDGARLERTASVLIAHAALDPARVRSYVGVCQRVWDVVSPSVHGEVPHPVGSHRRPVPVGAGRELFRHQVSEQYRRAFETLIRPAKRLPGQCANHEDEGDGGISAGPNLTRRTAEAHLCRQRWVGYGALMGALHVAHYITDRMLLVFAKQVVSKAIKDSNVQDSNSSLSNIGGDDAPGPTELELGLQESYVEFLYALPRSVGPRSTVVRATLRRSTKCSPGRARCRAAQRSERARFMLEDLLDLRAREWKPRVGRQTSAP